MKTLCAFGYHNAKIRGSSRCANQFSQPQKRRRSFHEGFVHKEQVTRGGRLHVIDAGSIATGGR
jgi:hypothetical protein